MSERFIKKLPFFSFLVFGFAIGTGGTQYVVTLAMEKLCEPEVFSQVTVILGYFVGYLLLIELGLQEDLIKRLCDGDKKSFSEVLVLRCIGAVLAAVLLNFSNYIIGVSQKVWWGSFCFSLVFFPAALQLGVEAYGYSIRQKFLASCLRMSRMVSLIVVSIIVIMFIENDTSAIQFASIFLLFPIIFLFVTVYFYYRFDIYNHFFREQKISIKELIHTEAIFKNWEKVWDLMLSRFFTWLGFGIFYHLTIYLLGDHEVGEFTMAMALSAPVGILMQVFTQTYFSSKSEVKKRIGGILVTASGAIYIAIFSFEQVHQMLFSHLSQQRFIDFFWPISVAVILGAWAMLIILKTERQRRQIPLIAAPLIIVIVLLTNFHFIPRIFSAEKIAYFWVLGYFVSFVVTWILIHLKKPKLVVKSTN